VGCPFTALLQWSCCRGVTTSLAAHHERCRHCAAEPAAVAKQFYSSFQQRP
jgi:hypothetical protein